MKRYPFRTCNEKLTMRNACTRKADAGGFRIDEALVECEWRRWRARGAHHAECGYRAVVSKQNHAAAMALSQGRERLSGKRIAFLGPRSAPRCYEVRALAQDWALAVIFGRNFEATILER